MLRKQAHRTEVKNSEIMTFYPLIHHLFQLIKPLPYYHIILFLFFSLHNITHKFTWIKKRTWWSNFVSSTSTRRSKEYIIIALVIVHVYITTACIFTRLWSLTSQWVKHHSLFITYIKSRNINSIQKTQPKQQQTTEILPQHNRKKKSFRF